MSLNVVSLVSGGKDSSFATLLATRAGHKIVALANFYAQNERDSWMYQTVATDSVEIYAKCLCIPFYRLALPPDLDLGDHESSFPLPKRALTEVEVLYTLLYAIKQAHPEVQAVVRRRPPLPPPPPPTTTTSFIYLR